MTTRTAATLALFAALLVGCSSTPPQKAPPVEVKGTVTLPSGQPAKDVTLNFLPHTADQTQGGTKLAAGGKFALKLVPGKYNVNFEGSPAAMQAIPTKYHSNNPDNAIEIPAPGASDLAIKLTN